MHWLISLRRKVFGPIETVYISEFEVWNMSKFVDHSLHRYGLDRSDSNRAIMKEIVVSYPFENPPRYERLLRFLDQVFHRSPRSESSGNARTRR